MASSKVSVREVVHQAASGGLVLLGLLVVLAVSIAGFIAGTAEKEAALVLPSVLVFVVASWALAGLFVVNPNEARVLQLFGRYVGTVKDQGLRWANPLFTKRPISLRVRSFESAKLKVNDHDGNPIEIASIIVWRVTDSAQALFDVEDYQRFVTVQAESALRNLATRYAYDAHEEGSLSLRGNTAEIAEQLKQEIQTHVKEAGVEVTDARISHLAYSPEIAQAMLQRQQAGAIIAARQRIVEGAVGMVELALERLEKKATVQLDEERKAAMVSNLLVVLCSERAAQPVVNAGTLYT